MDSWGFYNGHVYISFIKSPGHEPMTDQWVAKLKLKVETGNEGFFGGHRI